MFPYVPPAAIQVAAYLAGIRAEPAAVTPSRLRAGTGLADRTLRMSIARLRDIGAIEVEPRRPGTTAGSGNERPWVVTMRRSHWLWQAMGLVPCVGGCGSLSSECICDAFENDGVAGFSDISDRWS